MKEYRELFKDYIRDLAQRTPHPGGGSCGALAFCLGVSLLQMALEYSGTQPQAVARDLEKTKEVVYPLIDEDGRLFEALMGEKDEAAKKLLLDKGQALVCMLGDLCQTVLSRARQVETQVKRSLASDFYLGLKFLDTALFASLENLRSNQLMFKVDNSLPISRLESYREEFRSCLKY